MTQSTRLIMAEVNTKNNPTDTIKMSVGYAGGGDGGRTRVQKAIHDGIYKFSLSTTFPYTQADKQAVCLVAS